MKPYHIGTLSPENYVCRSEDLMTWSLENFKTIPMDSVIFGKDVQGISVFFGEMNKLIGFRVYSDNRLQTSGDSRGAEIFFPLESGKEIPNRIDIRRDDANNFALEVCLIYSTYDQVLIFVGLHYSRSTASLRCGRDGKFHLYVPNAPAIARTDYLWLLSPVQSFRPRISRDRMLSWIFTNQFKYTPYAKDAILRLW
jgi:hypothetical protein